MDSPNEQRQSLQRQPSSGSHRSGVSPANTSPWKNGASRTLSFNSSLQTMGSTGSGGEGVVRSFSSGSNGRGWKQSGGGGLCAGQHSTHTLLMLFVMTFLVGGTGVYLSAKNTSWLMMSEGSSVSRQYYSGENGNSDSAGDMRSGHGQNQRLGVLDDAEQRLRRLLPDWNTRRECAGVDETSAEVFGSPSEMVPNLIHIHTWMSEKEVDEKSISIVTQLSADRLPNLEDQCISWPDRVVAAVYVPMTVNSSGGLPLLPSYSSTTLDDMIRGIDSFHKFMEETAVCALDLVFLGQFIDKTDFPGPYPVNALRNRALSLVRSELSVHVNVDFLVNPLLGSPGQGYKDDNTYHKLISMAKKKTAYLLPSFKLYDHGQDLKVSRNIARNFALTGKSVAKGAYEKKRIILYGSEEPDDDRDSYIDMKKWLKADDHTQIRHAPGTISEPCILVASQLVPWFDERFVDDGFGANIWLEHLDFLKFKFKVHHKAFTVHMPHEKVVHSSRYLSNRHGFRLEIMSFLKGTLVTDIQKKRFKPLVRQCEKYKVSKSQDPGKETQKEH